jgi:hypothetical protein
MDRRLLLFILSALLAVVLGFVVVPADRALNGVIYGGYWAMLLLVVLAGFAFLRLARAAGPGRLAALREAPRWPVLLVAGCGTLLLVHETYGFKILMDEVMLLGTSMSMHLDKTAVVPMRGHDIQGAFQLMAGQLDKRPLLQPFLVSLLHGITGYRPENVFVLNTVLTYVLLALGYLAGTRLAGRGAGAVVVLLLTSLPLLAQNATGGGFELLNLVLILATLLLAMRHLARRDGPSQDALGLAAILLANTRYESAIYLLPAGLTILWVWWQERRPVVTWLLVAMPLLLVPAAWQNKVFSVRESAWELAGQPGSDRVFSPAYLPDNVGHALNFLFSTTGEHSNSLVLSALGCLALPFFALWCLKRLARLRESPPAPAALALFGLGFALHTLLLLCYFWGKFDDPVIRRLSLPLHLVFALAIVAVAAEFGRGARPWRVLAALTAAGLVAWSLPAMARHDYSLDYYVGREMEWRREFIAAHPEKDYLFIDNNSIIWITHLVSATPVQQTVDNKGNLLFNFRNRIFSTFYVFQRLDVDPETGATTVQKEDRLGADYRLETVWERRFTPLTVSRISRITAIDEQPPPSLDDSAPAALRLPPAELEKIRQEYLDHFIQRLP